MKIPSNKKINKENRRLYIGLMSGTSCDGIDASLIRTNGSDSWLPISNYHQPYKIDFQNKLRNLIKTHQGFLDIEIEMTQLHALAVEELLKKANISTEDIVAIGFHGQTIFHDPSQGICWQIGNPHILATKTNIDVVYDFRRRDVAHGGQGAPLIPIFHKCIANKLKKPLVIFNIGGVANLTSINEEELIAFDSGPGNALINDAMQYLFNKQFDKDGEIAEQGKVDMAIIDSFMQDEYFHKNYPKSLDRNHFNYLLPKLEHLANEDVIATLTYFSAFSIFHALELLPQTTLCIYLTGGGAKNIALKKMLTKLAASKNIEVCSLSDSDLGLDIDFIESQGFAYLAARFTKNLPSSFPGTTGIDRPTIAGVLVRK